MPAFVRSREHREAMVGRLRVLTGAMAVLMAMVVVRYWAVQGVQGPRYRELAENNRLRRVPIAASRGVVLDVEGRSLAENVPSYDLYLDLGAARSVAASLAFAAGVLETPREVLEGLVESARSQGGIAPVLLAESLSLAAVARIELATLEHPEFSIEVEQLRLYRHRQQTAHVLGYLGEIDAQALARAAGGYQPGELVGRRGVERRYEDRLRGVGGERVVVVDSRGRLVEEYPRREAHAGEPLQLALDLDLQQAAQRQLEGKVGAVVALDPRSGAVRALYSSPSYDPNLFARRLNRAQWKAILDSPHHPLQNRALQSAYSPGSVLKIVLGLAGLEEGLMSASDRVFCSGSAVFFGRRFRCWSRGGHGWVDLGAALEHSCDVYFYQLGQQLGIEKIGEWARRFGLGEATGIDLGGEKRGLVPSLAWSLRVRRHPWYPGETISVAIGQGPLLATPLQLAVLTASVANRGVRPTPWLATPAPPVAERLSLRPESWDAVARGLSAVVEKGTGRRARVDGLELAGKTGTVQVISQSTWVSSEDLPFEERDHAWFASYAPAHAPQLVVVVFVEHGGAGSKAAAPVAKAIYEEYLAKRPDLRSPAPA